MYKIFLSILIFLFLSFNFINAQNNKPRIIGPRSAPDITGPKIHPPSRAEINKLKYTKDPEFMNQKPNENSGFWGWLLSLFSWF